MYGGRYCRELKTIAIVMGEILGTIVWQYIAITWSPIYNI